MKNIEEILKKSTKKDVKIPQKVEYRIQYTLKNKTKKQSKGIRYFKKFVESVATVVIIGTFGVTVYAGVTGNLNLGKEGLMKLSNNYEENAVAVNKSIENEYFNITLESMAADSSYIIAKYEINLKEKALNEFKEISYSEIKGYNLGFTKEILINNQKATKIKEYMDKISNSKYTYIQLINIMDMKENKFDLDINLKTLFVGYGYLNTKDNEVEINKKIQAQISFKNKEKNSNEKIEQQLDENTKIIIEKIANTKFESFMKVNIVTENLTMKEYNKKTFLKYYNVMITKEDNEEIPYITYAGNRTIYQKEDGQLKEVDVRKIREDDIVKVEEEYTVQLGLEENIQKLKITPTKTTLYNDRTNEEAEYYKKATWYPIVEGNKKYTAKSGLGGTLEINNIKIDDKNITFNYNVTGNIGKESLLIIRRNNGKMNYIYPSREEKKGINGDENRIIYYRQEEMGRCGLDVSLSKLDVIDDVSQFEFTLLYGSTTQLVGETVELEVPAQSQEVSEISNIKIVNI